MKTELSIELRIRSLLTERRLNAERAHRDTNIGSWNHDYSEIEYRLYEETVALINELEDMAEGGTR